MMIECKREVKRDILALDLTIKGNIKNIINNRLKGERGVEVIIAKKNISIIIEAILEIEKIDMSLEKIKIEETVEEEKLVEEETKVEEEKLVEEETKVEEETRVEEEMTNEDMIVKKTNIKSEKNSSQE